MMIDILTRNIPDPETQTVIDSLTEKLNSKPFLVGNWSFLSFTANPKSTYFGFCSLPVGAIIPWSGTVPPDSSFRNCDGNGGVKLSKSDYPEYYEIARAPYGGDDAGANIPNFSGKFLRQFNGSSSVDPDSASRTAMNAGGATGNNPGSVQADAIQNITGFWDMCFRSGSSMYTPSYGGAISYYNIRSAENTGANGAAGGYQNGFTFDASRVVRTSTETRPNNVNTNYIIKVKSMGEKISVPHSLNFKPEDVIISSVIPLGDAQDANVKVLYGDANTNNKTIAITVDRPCKVRMFIGSYEEKR